MRSVIRYAVITLVAFTVTFCASELERTRKERRGLPVEEVDLSQVYFTDVYTEKPVAVADYMEEHELQFLLLMFGSVNCTKCNEKALTLSHNYIGKHDLFLSSSTQPFALVGVNTDSGGSQKQFRSIMLQPDERARLGYDFVQWADPAGDTLIKSLLGDNRFGVPFTVMLNRKGILWRYTNTQSYTIDELIKHIEDTLADRQHADGGGGSNDDDHGSVQPPTEFPLLSFAHPQRFSQLQMRACDGKTVALGRQLSEADLTLVQISKGRCQPGSVCAVNQAKLANVTTTNCGDLGRCAALTLTLQSPDRTACERGVAGHGGKEFLEVFATHFNWRYDPIVDDYDVPMAIPPVSGPVVLGFRSSGALIYSHEGALPEAGEPDAVEAVIAAGARTPVAGIDVPIFGALRFGDAPVATDLAAIRQQAKYTVMGAFDRYCSGCIDELEHWSQPGQLAGYCADHPGFCQVVALEAELANPNTSAGRAQLYGEIKSDYLDERGVKIPLLIDVEEFGDGYSRLFSSYFSPLFANWQGMYGTVIYDREGKVVASFTGGAVHDPDPVLQTLHKLHEYP